MPDNHFRFDETTLTDMERQLPTAIQKQYALMSCLKYAPEKQIYIIKEKTSGTKAVLKCASGAKAALLATEAEFLKTNHFSFLPEFYTSVREGDIYCLVREYIEGETLEDYVEHREGLLVREALSFLYTIAGYIGIFHSQTPPILHRDIKPQNFLRATDGRLVMLDVETVRTYNPSASHDTMIIGTANTAAPEQFGYSQTSIKSDIYGLGMLLIYLLTGDYSREKQHYAFLPHTVRRLIQKCIHFDPDKRYRSIRALRWDITSIRRFHMRTVPLFAALCITVSALCCSGTYFFHQHQIAYQHSHSVQFTNPYLEAAARQALHRSVDDMLTLEDLSQIHSLLLVGENTYRDWSTYTDYYNLQWFEYAKLSTPAEEFPLDDLKYFTGLRELALDVHNISDLSALSGLSLKRLSLRNSNITDLSPLSSMNGLEYLCLSENPLTDISPISKIPSLKELDITNTPVADIHSLAGTSLVSLNCVGSGVSDYSCVTSMSSLTTLRVSHVGKDDIALINSLTQLNILSLQRSQLTSFEEIKDLSKLTSLDITNCDEVRDLEHVSALLNLEYLSILGTGISDLTPLADLPRLFTLEAANTPVVDFTPLSDCPKLRQLYLGRAMAEELNYQLPGNTYDIIVID